VAKRDESQGEIDWASAQVADGVLTVALRGDVSKAWAERVERVVERLHRTGGGWESIAVTRSEVKVTAVQAGAEGDLRHFLEGTVMQANADFAPEPEEHDDGDEAETGVDREMTDAFRAFGPDPEDDAADEKDA
jgi:hypothetical protein